MCWPMQNSSARIKKVTGSDGDRHDHRRGFGADPCRSRLVGTLDNRRTTEIVVTDRRVIYVHGFVQRQSIEVHMNQIESVDVDQSLFGRLLNYGDVTIRGTGTSYEPLRAVDRPIALRNEITAR